MASKRNSKSTRATKRSESAQIQLMGVGLALVLIPTFVTHSIFGQGLTPMRILGGLMIVAGFVVFWLKRKKSTEGSPTAGPYAQGQFRGTQNHTEPPPGPVDLTVTEPEHSAKVDQAKSVKPHSKPENWSAEVFDVMEWRRFEAVVERLFQQAGFETKSKSHGADEGVDVWLYSRHQPGSPVSLVQCKHWRGKRVGVDKIRELRGVMAAHNVKRGQFATTSSFTADAIAFARENSVNLLDVDGLLSLIAKRTPIEQSELLAVAFEGEYWRPTCVNCGVKMVDRKSGKDDRAFWGCSNYPKCRTTMPMRVA